MAALAASVLVTIWRVTWAPPVWRDWSRPASPVVTVALAVVVRVEVWKRELPDSVEAPVFVSLCVVLDVSDWFTTVLAD